MLNTSLNTGPKMAMKRQTIWMDEHTLTALKSLSDKKGISQGETVRMLIRAYASRSGVLPK